MAKDFMSDEMVEEEILRLQCSPHVKRQGVRRPSGTAEGSICTNCGCMRRRARPWKRRA